MAKTTVVKKKIRKSAAAKLLETPAVVEQEQVVQEQVFGKEPDTEIPVDAKYSLLESENEALHEDVAKANELADRLAVENKALKRNVEQLKEEIVTVKENAKKLNTLFESYEIELLKAENEALKAKLAKIRTVKVSRNPDGTNKAVVMAPTNGYEYW